MTAHTLKIKILKRLVMAAHPSDLPPTASVTSRPNLRRWFGKGSWAVLDQALFGAVNFGINVLLARWLSAPAYGAFAVAFATYFLMLAFYNALIIEPMLVFGPARYRDRQALYIGLLSHLQWGFAVLGSLAFLIASSLLPPNSTPVMASTLRGLALATPFLLFFWFMRRACYVRHQPRLAALGGGAYSTLVLPGVWLLQQRGALSVDAVLYVMGAASLITGLGLARWLQPAWDLRGQRPLLRDVLHQHWVYGRWAAATRVPMRMPTNVIYLALPLWGGLGASGALKALLNLIQPFNQVISALTVLLIPTLARQRHRTAFFTLTHRLLLIFTGATALGWIGLGLLGPLAIEWLYDGSFLEYAPLLWVLGLLPMLGGIASVLGAALRADERPDWIFWAYVMATGIGLPLTLVLITQAGLTGAAIGMVLMAFITAAAIFVYYRRLSRSKGPAPRRPRPHSADLVKTQSIEL